jgi:hypothetical protein
VSVAFKEKGASTEAGIYDQRTLMFGNRAICKTARISATPCQKAEKEVNTVDYNPQISFTIFNSSGFEVTICYMIGMYMLSLETISADNQTKSFRRVQNHKQKL